jgi:hypothetical protein
MEQMAVWYWQGKSWVRVSKLSNATLCNNFDVFEEIEKGTSLVTKIRLSARWGTSNSDYRYTSLNPLKPNDHYSGRTAPLTSKRFILYIYSTNTGTEYFKNGIYSPIFFSSKCSLFHNSNVFGSCIIQILYTECTKI